MPAHRLTTRVSRVVPTPCACFEGSSSVCPLVGVGVSGTAKGVDEKRGLEKKVLIRGIALSGGREEAEGEPPQPNDVRFFSVSG